MDGNLTAHRGVDGQYTLYQDGRLDPFGEIVFGVGRMRVRYARP